MGMFDTFRFQRPIGLSVVELIGVDGGTIRIPTGWLKTAQIGRQILLN